MIQAMGPHQWEQMAKEMEHRTGKQCRERWHNQLNPLLKKANWTVEEDWILFILHQTVRNRWAEITTVLIGRSDNSIKNYWNSILSHKQAEYEQYLNAYLKVSMQDNIDSAGAAKTRQQVLQGLLHYYIHAAQNQYFEYIRQKIDCLQAEVYDPTDKVTLFKIRLLEYAITPESELGIQDDQRKRAIYQNMSESSQQDMLELRELKQFHKSFMQNQLCRNIQSALKEAKSYPNPESEPHGPIPMKDNGNKKFNLEDQLSDNSD